MGTSFTNYTSVQRSITEILTTFWKEVLYYKFIVNVRNYVSSNYVQSVVLVYNSRSMMRVVFFCTR